MRPSEAWKTALEHPGEDIVQAYARRVAEPDGWKGTLREAIHVLVPRVDWAGHLPAMPHGVLGLWALVRLRPLLELRDWHRLAVLQLWALARTERARPGAGLFDVEPGEGRWSHVDVALRRHRPMDAWGEVQGVASVESMHFTHLMDWVGPDMANVGHKAVAVHRAWDLFERLERPHAVGRILLGWAAWVAASEPVDTYWHDRMVRRLEGFEGPVEAGRTQSYEARKEWAEVLETQGLVATLDAMNRAIRGGWGQGDLIALLVDVAARKLLDARSDLEGKTGWLLVYLATVAGSCLGEKAAIWGQAAALVNFYPSEDSEDRWQEPSWGGAGDPGMALREAILDGEPRKALGLVAPTLEAQGRAGVLGQLAATVAQNDPSLDRSSQLLTLAASIELLDRIPEDLQLPLLKAMAKSLAASQTSSEGVRRVDRILGM